MTDVADALVLELLARLGAVEHDVDSLHAQLGLTRPSEAEVPQAVLPEEVAQMVRDGALDKAARRLMIEDGIALAVARARVDACSRTLN
ncbi:hypothetical protein [Aeromicrobium sp. NPDC092404]|uniref:hypothetical protein n=1 Tax=Aeromicrobium sp. NPDC092404 TaxID=3154976 RepID=UPI00343839E5